MQLFNRIHQPTSLCALDRRKLRKIDGNGARVNPKCNSGCTGEGDVHKETCPSLNTEYVPLKGSVTSSTLISTL